MIQTLQTRLQSQSPLEELLHLANIPSSIKHKSGIKKITNYVAEQLEILGFAKIDYIRSIHPKYASTLIAESNPEAAIKIILVCHADTVVAPDSDIDFVVNGDLLIGPGVADNTGGIIVLLESLRKLPLKDLNFNFVVLVSGNEELGSPGFNSYFRKFGEDAHAVFGFEPSLPNGDIISQRNGNYWLEVTAKGIEAHSGRCCGEELNIAHDFILKFTEILEISKNYPTVKINIGSLQTSKDVFNIVCGDLSAKIDFRYSQEDEFQPFLEKVKTIFLGPRLINRDGKAGSLQFLVHDHCPPLEKNIKADQILSSYLKDIKHIEKRDIQLSFSGGASDTNYLSSPNSFCADGFGPVGGRLHRMDEFVFIPSLQTRSTAFANFIINLQRRQETKNANPFI